MCFYSIFCVFINCFSKILFEEKKNNNQKSIKISFSWFILQVSLNCQKQRIFYNAVRSVIADICNNLVCKKV